MYAGQESGNHLVDLPSLSRPLACEWLSRHGKYEFSIPWLSRIWWHPDIIYFTTKNPRRHEESTLRNWHQWSKT